MQRNTRKNGGPAAAAAAKKTGAGVAALLALHYRARYPSVDVRAWCFAPPGGLMSPGAAASLEGACHSLVSAKVRRGLTGGGG